MNIKAGFSKLAMIIVHNLLQHVIIKHLEINSHIIKDSLYRDFVVTTHVPLGHKIIYVFTGVCFWTYFKIFWPSRV